MLLAGAGAMESAYLTLAKVSGADVACPATGPLTGCASVLNSEWASLFGIVPLSLLGAVAYGGLATLAAVGLSRQQAGRDERGDAVTKQLRSAMLGGGTVLATTSTFLIFILATKFPGELCPYCLASAGLSLAVLAAALRGFSGRELADAAMPASSLLAVVAMVLAVNASFANNVSQAAYRIDYQEPPVTTVSTTQAVKLAKELRAVGARFYGAFWCSHCYDQKEAFGAAAMQDLPYVECYPDGFSQETSINPACEAAGIKGFPTWVIGGQTYEGQQSFEALAAAAQAAREQQSSS